MGCCLTRNRYAGCEDKESLIEVMKTDLKNYKSEMENEANMKTADILLAYINDFKSLITEIQSRNIKRFERVKDLLINLVDHFETHKKTDNEYHKKLTYLKEFLATQKVTK